MTVKPQAGTIPGVMMTYTGKIVKPLELRPKDVDPIDIAHALANITRYNGHAQWPLSVAEHSVRCARRVSKTNPDRPWLLLHDAPETYLGDLIAPLKYLPEFTFYREVEDQVMLVICERFGLDPVEPECVHEIDMAMRATEMRDIRPPPPKKMREGQPEPYAFKIVPWNHNAAKNEFLKEMKALGLK